MGSPLFAGPSLDEHWSTGCDDLARTVDRLRLIGSRKALTLLRASFSAPRVIHFLRCSPSALAQLGSFHNLLRSAIYSITKVALCDIQGLPASLPVNESLVRRVPSLALPAFLAAAAGTLPLRSKILCNNAGSADATYQMYVSAWTMEMPFNPASPTRLI